MLSSSSNRFGALDFQVGRENYVARDDSATLDELHEAAIILDEGGEQSPGLDAALLHGTTLGGARPKAMLELARRAGICVPESKVVSSLGKEVLLVKRFDRDRTGGRRHVVSGLTMAQTDEMHARYVSYPQILDVLRRYAKDGAQPGPELFRRIAMNIAISNNDDHARNHAAFWDGRHLELTPAYDLAPGQRSGDTFEQAMAFGRGNRGVKVSNFAKGRCCRRRHSSIMKMHHSDEARVPFIGEADGGDIMIRFRNLRVCGVGSQRELNNHDEVCDERAEQHA